ncbi:hypothetical protein RJ640_001095, partial [Escallonia rubra]
MLQCSETTCPAFIWDERFIVSIIKRVKVENPHFEDGVHDIGEAQSITFKDCDTHAETITVRNYDARDGGKGCSEFDSEQILGKVFATEEEACFFYNQYALVKGFGTRLHFSNKRGAMKQVYRKQLVCNKQGFKCLKDKRHIGRQPKRRRETRIGCEAMFQISLSKDGYWFVEKFNDVHNHEMIGTPSKVIKYRSHSRFHRSRALASRRRAEKDEDFVTRNSKAVFYSGHPIEKRAGECYTRNLFEILKKERKSSLNCAHETLTKEAHVITYIVGFIDDDKSRWRLVNYDNREGVRATCSCAKFETEGILCKHILYIMRKKKVMALPEHYILPRWTINARYKVGNIG